MNKYDIWLKARGSGVIGPGIEPPYEFSRKTHREFKDALCELIACYPHGKLDDFDQSALDVIWDAFNQRRSEAVPIREADLPSELVNNATQPSIEREGLRIFEGGYVQYAAYLVGSGVEGGLSWCWQRDRFHLYADYRVDRNGEICAVKLPMLAACAIELNDQLVSEIRKLTELVAINGQPVVAQTNAAGDERTAFAAAAASVPSDTVVEAKQAQTTTRRARDLHPQIQSAQRTCQNPNDTQEVFDKLREMAKRGEIPFIGVTEDRLQWVDAKDQARFLSKRNLADRLRRRNPRSRSE